MKLKSAMRNLKHQREWLGIEWAELFALLRETASEFPDIIIESFETYKNHIEVKDKSDKEE